APSLGYSRDGWRSQQGEIRARMGTEDETRSGTFADHRILAKKARRRGPRYSRHHPLAPEFTLRRICGASFPRHLLENRDTQAAIPRATIPLAADSIPASAVARYPSVSAAYRPASRYQRPTDPGIPQPPRPALRAERL